MSQNISKINAITVSFICLTSILFAQTKEEFVGEWKGKLNAGGILLTIIFHVDEIDEQIVSKMDSPDQGAYGFIVTETIINKDKITFKVPSIGGVYEGKLDESWIILEGTWKQAGQSFELNMNKQSERTLTPDEIEFTEIYEGPLKAGPVELRIVIKIYKKDTGELVAYMDSPDQGAKNIVISSIAKTEKELIFDVQSIQGSYKGKFVDPDSVEGIWRQAGQNMELNLKRIDEITKINRPQTPTKPYPYKEEEVKFKNESANIELAGTLTLPNGEGPFPAVVLVSGSGPQDRDETIFEHRPFLVIADYFTRSGIAVLRYDDRGVGASSGDFTSATTLDFASDAIAAVNYLVEREEVNNNLIGIVGHSEGGLVAPIAAEKLDEIDFLVLMAGPGLPGKDILLMQSELITRAMGESEENINMSIELNTKIYSVIEKEDDNEKALEQIDILLDEFYEELDDSIKTNPVYSQETMRANMSQVTTDWFRYFINYDPRPTLSRTTIPVLAIIGEKDLQVPPKENLKAIEKALTEAGNKNFKTIELKNLNHLFQNAETGTLTEYAKIEETFSEEALKIMKDWILEINN